MSVAPWMKPVRHAICAAALGLAAVAAVGQAAWAQAAAPGDDEVEDHVLNTDKRLLNGLLGAIGLGSSPGPAINYRERSPLVVPQNTDLPTPGKAARGSDWPVDDDVKQAKKEASAELRGWGRKGQAYDGARPITGTAEAKKTGYTGTWTEERKHKEPDFITMLMQGRLSGTWEEYGKFDGEPPRTSLVQPPAGYLTPSPAAPYGMTPYQGQPQKKESK